MITSRREQGGEAGAGIGRRSRREKKERKEGAKNKREKQVGVAGGRKRWEKQ